MENYKKGKNVEQVLDKDNIPINIPEDCLWMRVTGGSKLRNLLTYALQKFPKHSRSVLWSGSGPSIAKTISCAEIIKKEVKNLHQITRICYTKVEEYWEPLLEDLDQIVVKRNIPTIFIFLSVDTLDSAELGYQASGDQCKNRGNHSKTADTLKTQLQISKKFTSQNADVDHKDRRKKQKK